MSAAIQLALFESPSPLPAVRSEPIEQPRQDNQAITRRKQAWLALHFADFSLAAALAGMSQPRRDELHATPWAVVDDDRLKHVVACSPAAWEQGVRPGHSLNAAIALCADIALVSRDEGAEAQLLAKIAEHCLTYTSTVSIQPPNEVLLEVRGSFRLFGGATGIIERVQTDLQSLGLGLQMALAPTARSALWLSRSAKSPLICHPKEVTSTLASLSISHLNWPLPVQLQLLRYGVATIGDLLRLPRKDLARRIGFGPVRELQQALGRTEWLHRSWSSHPTYRDRVMLDFEVETTALLEKLLRRPLLRLQARLVRSVQMLDELRVTLKHRESATDIRVRLQQPTADMQHVAALLHEQLDRLTLCAPIREVFIEVGRLLSAESRNRVFTNDPGFASDTQSSTDRSARLLEQLLSRLGPQCVHSLDVRAEYVPERAQSAVSPTAKVVPAASVPRAFPQRPLWFLREPKPIDREYRSGELQVLSSPETIEVESWQAPAIRRAYYRARTRLGIQWWIFRELVPPHRWFLHGLFG